MRKLTTKLSIFILMLFVGATVQGQMLNSNKMTEVALGYVQFPTEGKILGNAYIQFTDTQTGAGAMLNRVFQKKMGMAGSVNITTTKLSQPIFFSEGDISVVITAREPKVKEYINFMGGKGIVVFGDEHASASTSSPIYAETSFQVYQGEQMIFEQGPVNLVGYEQMGAAPAMGSTGGDLTSLKAMTATHAIADHFPHEELALEYVENILKARYGMGMGQVDVKPYYVSGLKRDNKKQSEAFSETLVSLAPQFQLKMGEDDYNQQLAEAITFYKGLEGQYSDEKKAEVDKKNIWQIQSNIAIAYFLSENPAEAQVYMQKALDNRDKTIIKKESASGKAGFSAGLAMNYLKFAPKFIQACADYKKGLEANPSEFVAQFKDYKARKQIDDKAQELLIAYELGFCYSLDLPVNIYDCGGQKIKKVTGTIATNGEEFSYKYNKVWYAFVQKLLKKDLLYVTTVKSVSNPKDKVKVGDYVYYSDWSNDQYIVRPGHANNKEFKMISSTSLGKFGMFGENTERAINNVLPARQYEDFVTNKKLSAMNRRATAPSFPMSLMMSGSDRLYPHVQFTTNNDIVVAIRNERDKPDFEVNKMTLEQDEVLFYDEIIKVHKFEEGKLNSISTHSYSVARDRDAKLPLDAKAWKMSHAGQLLPTTVVNEETHSEDITMDGNAIKIVKDGKAQTINKSIEKSGENWTSISFGETKITRTIM